jgi:hypothetical protein
MTEENQPVEEKEYSKKYLASQKTKEEHRGKMRTMHFEAFPIRFIENPNVPGEQIPVKDGELIARIKDNIRCYHELLSKVSAPIHLGNVISSDFQLHTYKIGGKAKNKVEGDDVDEDEVEDTVGVVSNSATESIEETLSTEDPKEKVVKTANLFLNFEVRNNLFKELFNGESFAPLYELRNFWFYHRDKLAKTHADAPDFEGYMWDMARTEIASKVKQMNADRKISRELLALQEEAKPIPSFRHAPLPIKYFPNVASTHRYARLEERGDTRIIWLRWDRRLGEVPFLVSGAYLYDDKTKPDVQAERMLNDKKAIYIGGLKLSFKPSNFSWSYMFHKFANNLQYWSNPCLNLKKKHKQSVFTVNIAFCREPVKSDVSKDRTLEIIFDRENTQKYLLMRVVAKAGSGKSNDRFCTDSLGVSDFLNYLSHLSKRHNKLESRKNESAKFGRHSSEWKVVRSLRNAMAGVRELQSRRVKQLTDEWAKYIVRRAIMWQCGEVKVYNLPVKYLLCRAGEDETWLWPWYQFKSTLKNKCFDVSVTLSLKRIKSFEKKLESVKSTLYETEQAKKSEGDENESGKGQKGISTGANVSEVKTRVV